MTQKKENSKQLTNDELLAQFQQAEENKKFALEMAIKSFKHDGCVKNTRRLYFQMCLQFCTAPENGVDDDDHLTMLTLFEFLNCL
jgi:hypothetical protein